MVINSNLTAATLPNTKPSPATPATPQAMARDTLSQWSSVSDQSISQSPEGTDLTSEDMANHSVESAINSIRNNPGMAMVSQANLSPESVFSLLQI